MRLVDIVNQMTSRLERTSPSIETRILDRISALLHHVQASMNLALKSGGGELAAMQARCLSFIDRHPECTESDIVRESGRDKGQIARLVAGLIARRYVTRLPDAPDRRKRRLLLTSDGHMANRLSENTRRHVACLLFEKLTKKERAAMEELLGKVCESLLSNEPK